MTGVSLPGADRIPPGPHRTFLEALHLLYAGAGKPALRRIATDIAAGDYVDTVSHEKVRVLLCGTGLPTWLKVECVVRHLAARHHPRLDPEQVVDQFLPLWAAADDARPATGGAARSRPPANPSRETGPAAVRGRDEIIERLSGALNAHQGRPQVLCGVAGIGKSAIAGSVAGIARRGGLRQRAWWVCAADEERLARDLTAVARDLGVSEADWSRLGARPAAELSGVADRVWELLEADQSGWLIVIDNADNPGLLGPQDGTSWIRGGGHGLMLVTTRDSDATRWPGADMIPVGPLPPQAAAQVLTDLAPGAGDRDAALPLAQQLGNVPMFLRLAGMHLRQHLGSASTFGEYQHALEHANSAELSLDALGQSHVPLARPLLWLLACYAPSSFIPEEVFTGSTAAAGPYGRPGTWTRPLAELLGPDRTLPAEKLVEHCRASLHGLRSAGLVDLSRSGDGGRVIRVHASIAEATRAVMADVCLPPGSPDPTAVRTSASTVASSFVRALDTGSAEHWPLFRALTPHIEELLLHTAAFLDSRVRQDLLGAAALCIAAHNWSKAERLAEQLSFRVMTLADDLGCRDQPVYLRLRHLYALARREQGWLAEAADDFRGILSDQSRMSDGETRLDTLRTRQQLSWTLGRMGRWEEAEEGLLRVLRLLDARQRQLGSESHEAQVLRLHARCMTYWCVGRQDRWDEAENGYRQLATDREEILGPDHPDTLDVRYNIGKTLAWQGKWAAAENEWRHNASDRAQALGDQHPDTLMACQLQLYADGYQAWQSGDRRRCRTAVKGLELVLGAQREKRGDDHRETLETRALLAVLRREYSPGMMWPEDLPRPGAD